MSEDSDLENTSSSSDDEAPLDLNEEFEKSFFKTLSSLKNNDPSIYDQQNKFFDESAAVSSSKSKKNNTFKEKPMFLKDYERKCLTENEGYEDESDQVIRNEELPYVLEQRNLKESFKSFLNDSEDEEDNNLLKPSVKSKEEVEKEESDYIQWLKGQKQELEDKVTEKNLQNLRDYWNSDNLDEDEAFLKDYILNKRFLDKDESGEEEDEENLSEDSETLDAQENYEQQYNFRFENGDNLIRRFPRNVDDSLRRKDNKRSKKRAVVKDRKTVVKKKKQDEINRQKKLKIKEISERLEKLKELTGNEKLAFNDQDIMNDFDPEEHDKKMSEMYNDDFYQEQDDSKPQIDDLDLGDIEETYDGQNEYDEIDYDEEGTSSSKKGNKKTRTKRKKERKKKAFNDVSMIEKPIYDPKLHQSYQNYMDEYYQLDCEDFIDDIPCRFKYRQVEPNDYGLSVEEILAADDKELNRWSSIKKIYKIRSSHVEKNEAKIYKLKGLNEQLKRKVLPSLFNASEERSDDEIKTDKLKQKAKSKKKSKNKTKPIDNENSVEGSNEVPENSETFNDSFENSSNYNNTKNSAKRKRPSENDNISTSDDQQKSKLHKKTHTNLPDVISGTINEACLADNKNPEFPNNTNKSGKKNNNNYKTKFYKNYKGGHFRKNHNFHDSRLSAYGINPKKFKFKS